MSAGQGSGLNTYVGSNIGVPLLEVSTEGDSLTTEDVDEGQADGGPKTGVQLLVDLLLVLDHKEGACGCEAHNGWPDQHQEHRLHSIQWLDYVL